MAPRPNASFGQTPWTVPYSTHSSSACAPGAAAGIRRRAADARPRLGAGAAARCSRRSTRSSSAASSCSCPTTPTRATPPRPRAGSSATTRWRSSRRAACAGAPGSSRRRTSSASARARSRCSRRGGLVCASAAASPRVCRRPRSGRRRSRLRTGDEPGIESLAEHLALGGLRARRARRGARAVRRPRRPVDVFPTTGREPLRIELFGDEIEQIRAFSPFTQRALRQVETATVYPAAERRARARRGDAARRRARGRTAGRRAGRPRAAARPRARLRLVSPTRCARCGPRRASRRSRSTGATELDSAAAGPAVLVRRAAPGDRGARALRGRERAERAAAAGARRRRRVPAPRRGAAAAGAAAPRRPRTCSSRATTPKGLAFAVSPARRGFVWRDLGVALLPDTQVFRKRPPRATAAPGRALQSFSDLRTGDYVVHEDHGVAQLMGFETKEVAGVTRDYLLLAYRGDDRVYVPHEQIGKVSRYIGADSKAPDALEARRQGVGQPEDACARAPARDGRRAAAALRAAADAAGRRLRRRARVGRAARGGVPVPRDRGSAHARSRR